MNLYYSFTLNVEFFCVGQVGGYETRTLVLVEPTLKYHPEVLDVLT